MKRSVGMGHSGRIARLTGELCRVISERFFNDEAAETVLERRLIVGIVVYSQSIFEPGDDRRRSAANSAVYPKNHVTIT